MKSGCINGDSVRIYINTKINGLNLVVKGQTSPTQASRLPSDLGPQLDDLYRNVSSVTISPTTTVRREAPSGTFCLNSSCENSLTLAFTVSLAFSIFSDSWIIVSHLHFLSGRQHRLVIQICELQAVKSLSTQANTD